MYFKVFAFAALLLPSLVLGQENVSGLSLTLGDIRQAEIALVNATTGPGLESVTQSLSTAGRESRFNRSSFGVNSDFTVKGRPYDGFLGASIIQGGLSERYSITSNKQQYHIDADRNIIAARASAGITLPYNQYVKIRPYLSFIVSDLDTQTSLNELPASVSAALSKNLQYFEFNSTAWSSVITAEFDYHRWYGDTRAEVLTMLNYSHTDTFSTDSPQFDSAAWGATAMIKAKFSRNFNSYMLKKPFVGHFFYNYTDYINQAKVALGFTRLHEVGLGCDWEWQVKPLDWVAVNALGVKFAYVSGDGVEGYNIGFTIR